MAKGDVVRCVGYFRERRLPKVGSMRSNDHWGYLSSTGRLGIAIAPSLLRDILFATVHDDDLNQSMFHWVCAAMQYGILYTVH